MKYTRSCLCANILLASAMLCGLSLAFARPPVGANIDERREIALVRTLPKACLSLSFGEFSLLISGEKIKSLIHAKPDKWRSEPERLATIAAGRAQALLSMSSGSADSSGCQVISASVPEDVKYLLVSEIEEGSVAVVDLKSGAFLEHVVVHYLAASCGPSCGRGDILVRLPDGKLLLGVNWWVS